MKYYAGIGARKTPADTLEIMTLLAAKLELMGYVLRSGAAEGADTAFEKGVKTKKEIFLPWKGFNKSDSLRYSPSDAAMIMAETLHPAWGNLSQAAKKLMARNCHQILGENLDTPVRFVICYTPDGCESKAQRTKSSGGTGQAIELADNHGIPVINLFNPNPISRIKSVL